MVRFNRFKITINNFFIFQRLNKIVFDRYDIVYNCSKNYLFIFNFYIYIYLKKIILEFNFTKGQSIIFFFDC